MASPPKNGARKPPPRKPWRPISSYVDDILARAHEPWVSFQLGLREVCRCRPGGIVVVMGPSGSGKTSLVADLLVNHARHYGPAAFLSLELEGDELAGRMIGMQTNASWEQVLRGDVPREHMVHAANIPRLVLVEEEDASLASMRATVEGLREVYVDEPIVVALDYVQIFELDEQEHRSRIALVMRALKKLAKRLRIVIVALNQMSRENARIARAGEKLGVEAADLAAESAAVERYANFTISIGGIKNIGEDGDQSVQLSLGKGRHGGGDRVMPARYEGRTGRWIIEGDARPAAEVKAELAEAKKSNAVEGALMSVLGAASKLTQPTTRSDLVLLAHCNKQLGYVAITRLLKTGELVEVRMKKKGTGGGWMVCPPELATEAQLPLLGEGPS